MRVVVIDFSPVADIALTATAGNALGFTDTLGTIWIAHGGVIAPPAQSESLAPNWMKSIGGQPAARSVATKKWNLPEIKRAQSAGDVVFADVLTKAGVRTHYWLDAKGIHEIERDLSFYVKAEVLGPRLVLLWDPHEHHFELLTPESRTRIALPKLIANDTTAKHQQARGIFALRDARTVVLLGYKRAYVFDLDELVALGTETDVDWFFDPVFPRGDPDLQTPGVVTMAKWGRTNIAVGERKITLGETVLAVDERVVLRELLWNAVGSQIYREIVRADGSVIPCPGAPEYPGETTRIAKR